MLIQSVRSVGGGYLHRVAYMVLTYRYFYSEAVNMHTCEEGEVARLLPPLALDV